MRRAMKDGSCAIGGCEPCQVGDQAALSGFLDVPQGRLSGACGTVSVCRELFDLMVYGLIRVLERGRACVLPRDARFFMIFGGGSFYVSRIIP